VLGHSDDRSRRLLRGRPCAGPPGDTVDAVDLLRAEAMGLRAQPLDEMTPARNVHPRGLLLDGERIGVDHGDHSPHSDVEAAPRHEHLADLLCFALARPDVRMVLTVDDKGGPGHPDHGTWAVLGVDAEHAARANDEMVEVGPLFRQDDRVQYSLRGPSLSSCLATACSPSPPSRQARSSVCTPSNRARNVRTGAAWRSSLALVWTWRPAWVEARSSKAFGRWSSGTQQGCQDLLSHGAEVPNRPSTFGM
jgi:hypothetical protein